MHQHRAERFAASPEKQPEATPLPPGKITAESSPENRPIRRPKVIVLVVILTHRPRNHALNEIIISSLSEPQPCTMSAVRGNFSKLSGIGQ